MPLDIRRVSDIPDDFVPRPLGLRADIIGRIREIAPPRIFPIRRGELWRAQTSPLSSASVVTKKSPRSLFTLVGAMRPPDWWPTSSTVANGAHSTRAQSPGCLTPAAHARR